MFLEGDTNISRVFNGNNGRSRQLKPLPGSFQVCDTEAIAFPLEDAPFICRSGLVPPKWVPCKEFEGVLLPRLQDIKGPPDTVKEPL